MRAAPAVSRAKQAKKTHTSIQVQRRAIRHSLRNGFTAYFVLSPAIGLSCHRRPTGYGTLARLGSRTSARLDAGVEASGPHDFTVRFSAVRPARRCPLTETALRTHLTLDTAASTASHPNVRDDGQRPFLGDRMAGVLEMICLTAKAKICPSGCFAAATAQQDG
jgi:hypothetical protein